MCKSLSRSFTNLSIQQQSIIKQYYILGVAAASGGQQTDVSKTTSVLVIRENLMWLLAREYLTKISRHEKLKIHNRQHPNLTCLRKRWSLYTKYNILISLKSLWRKNRTNYF